MKKKYYYAGLYLLCMLPLLTFVTCSPVQKQEATATTYDFPSPVDTKSRPIEIQEKKIFRQLNDNVFASNNFDGARLNNFIQINDTVYQAIISPENQPINDSPWYAFKLWSSHPKEISLQLIYTKSKHRYFPKLSNNGKDWQKISNDDFSYSHDSTKAILKLALTSDTLWLAAQEIINSTQVFQWCTSLEEDTRVKLSSIGESERGRPLLFMDIYQGEKSNKETIVLFSRQHPPEVTGFMAMQAFVQELLINKKTDIFFTKYRVMVYPLLNPDGVDMGHWRHNAGGVDLNRDWAYYHQPETKKIADHIVSQVKENKNDLILGVDFHSTWHDVYYTMDKEATVSKIPLFKDKWLEKIEIALKEDNYKINEKPSGLSKPISKGWFYTQFDAEGVTYEIGDDTPRPFIKKKGEVSANIMINILLENKYK